MAQGLSLAVVVQQRPAHRVYIYYCYDYDDDYYDDDDGYCFIIIIM